MMILFFLANSALALFAAWDTWQLLSFRGKQLRQWSFVLLAAVFLYCSMTTTPGYSVLIYYVTFLFLSQSLWRIVRKSWKPAWPVTVVCLAAAFALTAWGLVHYDQRIARHYTVETEKDADGRLVFLSDLHYPTGMTVQELQELTDQLEQEKPDAYILGGDIVDEYTSAQEAETVFRTLGQLVKTAPVYYVPGNHDDQEEGVLPPAYTEQELESMIEASGIQVLKDKSVTVGDFVLAGRDDFRQHKKDRMPAQELIADQERFTVVVDHQPVEADEVKEAGADLMLSGHTHNGQLWPFGYLIHLHPHMDQVYGIDEEDGFTQITSSGIGAWGFPVRTAGDSEYVVVDVTGSSRQ